MSLTAKQEAFVAEYLVDRNGKQAAIRAGYAPNSAKVTASRLLSHANVSREIAKGISRTIETVEVTAEKVLALAMRHAESDGMPGVKATELLMKYHGLLIERSESGKPGDFASDMTPEQRETKILELQAKRRKAG